MDLPVLRLASLLIITFIYMLFDVFNNRNIPDLIAYATFAYGVVLTLAYANVMQIAVSSGVALVILGIGYLVYRAGQVGAADIIELDVISLILPIQQAPLLAGSMNQFGIPFIVSVLLSTGIASIMLVPLYYLPKVLLATRKPIVEMVDRKGAFKASMLAVAYLLFMAFISLQLGTGIIGITLLAVMLFSSVALVLFETPITDSMVRFVGVGAFEAGDIIAFNLMKAAEIGRTKRKVRTFDRLITDGMIREMKEKRIKDKFPVYKKAIPLALPIFVGTVLSLLIGDIVFFLLPIV